MAKQEFHLARNKVHLALLKVLWEVEVPPQRSTQANSRNSFTVYLAIISFAGGYPFPGYPLMSG